jgi:hypothetical protein
MEFSVVVEPERIREQMIDDPLGERSQECKSLDLTDARF